MHGSYLVTLKEGTQARSAAGKGLAEQYGAKISHTYGAVLNGYAVRAGGRQAARLAADPRVASVVQDTRVRFDGTRRNPRPGGSTGSTSTSRRWTGATPGPGRPARG